MPMHPALKKEFYAEAVRVDLCVCPYDGH